MSNVKTITSGTKSFDDGGTANWKLVRADSVKAVNDSLSSEDRKGVDILILRRPFGKYLVKQYPQNPC